MSAKKLCCHGRNAGACPECVVERHRLEDERISLAASRRRVPRAAVKRDCQALRDSANRRGRNEVEL